MLVLKVRMTTFNLVDRVKIWWVRQILSVFITVFLMIGHVGPPLPCNKIKLVDVPEMEYYAKDGKGEVRKLRRSNLGFWETAYLPLP